MIITPKSSPITYYKEKCHGQYNKIQVVDEIAPILIIGSPDKSLPVMYLSFSETKPKPSSETHGLLLLSPKDIELICSHQTTLNEYLDQNGLALLKEDFNKDLILEPFPQLLFLADLLNEEPEILGSGANI